MLRPHFPPALPVFIPSLAASQSPVAASPITSSPQLVAPVVILALCLVAGVGTVMLLPSRRETPLRKLGGVIVLAAALILGALLVRRTAERMHVYFWIFSAVALVGAVRVVTHPRPVYSALYFVLTVLATAGLFVLLWAEFMAAALVLIYAGAILVTYVFVIMLAAEASESRPASTGQATTGALAGLAEHDAVSRDPLIASAVGYLLMGVLLFVIFDRMDGQKPGPQSRGIDQDATAITAAAEIPAGATPTTAPAPAFVPTGNVQQLGSYLFERQLVNLELAGLILTLAMVGAIVIARRRVVGPDTLAARTTGATETVTGPATPVDDNPHSIPVYGTENPRQKEYPET